MDLFGFEEDLDLHNSEVILEKNGTEPMGKTSTSNSDDRQKLTVSQIQDLLLQDLVNDTVSDQDTSQESETSIFEDTTASLLLEAPRPRLCRAAKTAAQNIKNDSSLQSEVTESVTEAPKVRPRRAPKKVLRGIENITTENLENTTQSEFKLPVTRAYNKIHRRKKVLQSIENTRSKDNLNSSSTKVKRITKKNKIINDENAKIECIAEEINNKFREVEQYKLVVE